MLKTIIRKFVDQFLFLIELGQHLLSHDALAWDSVRKKGDAGFQRPTRYDDKVSAYTARRARASERRREALASLPQGGGHARSSTPGPGRGSRPRRCVRRCAAGRIGVRHGLVKKKMVPLGRVAATSCVNLSSATPERGHGQKRPAQPLAEPPTRDETASTSTMTPAKPQFRVFSN